MHQSRVDSSHLTFLAGGGEMGSRMREMDWSCTALGPPETWPQSLRSTVSMLLPSKAQIALFWGPEFNILYNDAYRPVFGAKHPDALGRPGREAWSEIWEAQVGLRALLEGVVRTGEAFWARDLLFVLERYGFVEDTYFDVSYDPVRVESGTVGGVFCIVTETTERVVGERRLALLRDLAARNAAARTEREACELAMETLTAAPDVTFALAYLDDELQAATPGAQQQRAESRPDLVKTLIVPSSAGGRTRRLIVGVNPRRPFDESYRSFLDLVADQVATALTNARAYETERARAEALAEIDRAKTTFFSNVSHEFRTPLTLMLGPLDDALADPQTPAAVRAHLEIARRNAQRLLKLVNSLLDFARIEAGRMQASFAATDLSALTEDLASTFRSAMERAGLVFDVACEKLGAPVYVDREMWEKIVLNLLSNAFKFTLQGKVSVRLRRAADAAILEVADTGVGVAEDQLPRLFERFHRIEHTDARTHEGSGIGLALVQELVRLHGGDITAQSEHRIGTVFRIRIPFGTAHLPADRIEASRTIAPTEIGAQAYIQEALRWLPETSAPGTTSFPEAPDTPLDERFRSTFGSRIVLADDNADMRAYIRDLLGRFYRVETTADGGEALNAARRSRPDLILADVMMPTLDGFQLLKALRTNPEYADVPVILVSARAGEEARIEGLGAGADDYIVKPFHARELLARVGALLELTATRRANEARFRAFVQATSDGVYRMNRDWSEMVYLQGRSFLPDQTSPSRTWLQKYIHPEDQPQVMAVIAQAIDTKSILELEHRVIRTDGSLGWTFSRAVPLLDDAGEIVEWFGTASDVTERHATQEALQRQQRQLEEADRQKNEFLAMLAHELRNPLAPIRNASELLARTVNADPQPAAALATIGRQLSHLTRLVDDLLDISRITQNRIELRRRPIRLEHVIAQALEEVDPLMRQHRHRVTLVSAGTALLVNGDPNRLVQCISNVLTNAAKYTPPEGDIRIESRSDDAHAVVTIRDNGMGMSDALVAKVFDLFVQGERTLDRAQGGLGVGLSIVKRLVEMHGGTITATSAGPGCGSSFEIRLPLAHDTQPTAEPAATTTVKPRRILVVDDNEDGANMLAALLAFDGHAVTTSLSGYEAVDLAIASRPDVVLLDIGLPGLDGYEVAERIRSAADGTIRLVAITGYGRDEDRARAHAAGFSAHLVKPVNFEALRRVLADLT